MMNIQELTEYFLKYGAFFIYLIVFLEYLNLPGFPAGVIMPLSGIWAAREEISFPLVMLITLAAGLTGGRIFLRRACNYILYTRRRLKYTSIQECGQNLKTGSRSAPDLHGREKCTTILPEGKKRPFD